MALTAGNLIDNASVSAYPFLRDESWSPGALLRQLSALDREIVSYYALYAPDRLSLAGTNITIVGATNPTGYSLTAAKFYTDFVYVSDDDVEYDIEIVSEGRLPSRHPSAYVRSSTFLPIDPFARGWSTAGERPFYIGDGDVVKYRYVSEPSQVTTLAATLASPDEARSYIEAALTLEILLQSDGVPQDRLQVTLASMRDRRSALLLEMSKRTGVSSSFGASKWE